MSTLNPKTFQGWYNGNMFDEEVPFYSDGRALIRKSMVKNKTAHKILGRQGPGVRAELAQIEQALTRNRNLETPCEVTTIFTIIRGPSAHGIAVRVANKAEFSIAGAHAWFNSLPLLWMLKYVKHDTIKLYRSQIVFYLGDLPVALLMAVGMPDGAPEMTADEAMEKNAETVNA